MALSRKKKIIIAVSAVAVLGLIVIISVFARGTDQPEVTVVKVETRTELKSTVTARARGAPSSHHRRARWWEHREISSTQATSDQGQPLAV